MTDASKTKLKKEIQLLQTECMALLPCNYVGSNVHLANMRNNVIRNLIVTARNFNLHKTTAFLAVSCFDRFLSHHASKSGMFEVTNINIVAFTCLLISTKYFDTKLLPHSQLRELADECHIVIDVDDFVTTELNILQCLSWRITHLTLPSTYMNYTMHFLELCENPVTDEVYNIWLAWIEVALSNSLFLNVRSCLVCVTALCVTWKVRNEFSKVKQHVNHFCTICECNLREISLHMQTL